MNAYVGYAEEPLPYFRTGLLQFILGWLIAVGQFRSGVEPTGGHRLFRYAGGILIIVFINPVSLPLKRVSRQRGAHASLSCVNLGPVDIHSGHPEMTKRNEHRVALITI